MLANYGYSDGSGEYFITIDTNKCNGCGDCVLACPSSVFEVMKNDPNDPFREGPVAVVSHRSKNRLKYACAPCKPGSERNLLPCINACRERAISHSW